jgi:hypothetical protein
VKLHVVSLVAFAIWSLPQFASVQQDSSRPAWAWTDEERFAALIDEAAAARRLQAYRLRESERSRRDLSAITGADTHHGLIHETIDAIDGRRDPHLYFAWELFQRMVTGAYPDDAAAGSAYRDSKEEVRRALSLPDDMWQRMEPIVAAYRAARQRERDEALSPAGSGRSSITSAEVCTQRHLALLEAQKTFGDAFIRFLYLGVAPTMFRVAIQKPGDEVLRIARGECE